MIDTLNPFIEQVTTLKGPMVVVVFLIMIGYAVKVSGIPNKRIPIINFIMGALLSPILVEWPTPGSMDPDLRFPELAAWFTSVITGFLLACIAWITHDKFLRKFIDNKSAVLSPDRVSDEKIEVETHIEDGKIEKTKTISETVAEVKEGEGAKP